MFDLTRSVAGIALIASLASGCATTGYQAPRLADGQPDLQGTWTNVSLTGLTRPGNFKSLTVSEEDAERIRAMTADRAKRGLQPTDPNAPPPPKGSGVGGYNSFWGDMGEGLAKVNGEYRTSWIVDPEDGQLPYTEKGREIFNTLLQEQRNNLDDPEGRPMAERCIIGFGSTGGPPMLNVMYNNNYQIVQGPDTIMILVEMNHDARVIRMNADHRSDPVRPWLGDSVGRWDGDTLVIETTNFNPGESLRLYFSSSFYISEDAMVTERLTRVADDELFYEFVVEDPEIYSKPWRAEMVFKETDGPIYEYACHEGNYALPNILGGARQEEAAREQ
ncbi:hypothetical protein ACXYTJ_16680 [Gilvimarinus sp. F26214L]|uniref:hypothetical protein n=1 Tax=Gilvimarinus sp. DZF01 TaxID=3461371 RepID=UPI004045FFEF